MGSARDNILQELEDLTFDEFRKFKLKLQSVQVREGYGRIPRGQLQSMDVLDLTDRLVSTYTESYGVELTVQVLENMGLQEQAVRLRNTQSADPRTAPKPAPTAKAAEPQRSTEQAVHFLDRHRTALINRVTNVDAILDALYGEVLKDEEYQKVRAESTSANKMRMLFSMTPSWSSNCKEQMFYALKETHPHLVADLERS